VLGDENKSRKEQTIQSYVNRPVAPNKNVDIQVVHRHEINKRGSCELGLEEKKHTISTEGSKGSRK
jgi:hypothetical protein